MNSTAYFPTIIVVTHSIKNRCRFFSSADKLIKSLLVKVMGTVIGRKRSPANTCGYSEEALTHVLRVKWCSRIFKYVFKR